MLSDGENSLWIAQPNLLAQVAVSRIYFYQVFELRKFARQVNDVRVGQVDDLQTDALSKLHGDAFQRIVVESQLLQLGELPYVCWDLLKIVERKVQAAQDGSQIEDSWRNGC